MADDIVNTSDLRENLIATAIKFLSNPNVQRCTRESKQKFLRSKGLTEPEIQKAFERGLTNLPSVTAELMMYQHSKRSWLKDNLLPVVMYGGMAYGAYWIYKVTVPTHVWDDTCVGTVTFRKPITQAHFTSSKKPRLAKFIERLIFVDKQRQKTADEKIFDLKRSIDTLSSEMLTVRSDLDRLSGQQALNSNVCTQIEQLKADIASVKGILLNRNQFPTLKSHTSPPSIPAWQRQSAAVEVGVGGTTGEGGPPHSPPHSPPRPRSQRSQSGGSNSSEDHATKNSDSSLEIIS